MDWPEDSRALQGAPASSAVSDCVPVGANGAGLVRSRHTDGSGLVCAPVAVCCDGNMKPEFEEKSYEAAFNAELTRRTNLFFASGQRAEGWLGFDFVVHLDDPLTWAAFPGIRHRRATGMPLREMAEQVKTIAQCAEGTLPEFTGNLFIQYKRADYLSRPNAREWRHWRGPCYRFEIYQKQQKLLTEIVTRASGRAAVVYAAPAFHELGVLLDTQKKGAVICSSNISSVTRIGSGHEHFTYEKAGNMGKAFSEPVLVESSPFREILEQLKKEMGMSFHEHVMKLGENLEAAIEITGSISARWVDAKKAALAGFIGADGTDEEISAIDGSFLGAIVTVMAFGLVTGASVFLVPADGRVKSSD